MDRITLLIVASLVVGLFIGFPSGARRRPDAQGRDSESLQSFDERLAERLRKLYHET